MSNHIYGFRFTANGLFGVAVAATISLGSGVAGAGVLSSPALMGTTTVRIPKGKSRIQVSVGELDTDVIRVGLMCGARVREVYAVLPSGDSLKLTGRGTGVYRLASGGQFRAERFDVLVGTLALGHSEICTANVYNARDKSHEDPSLPQGTIQFVNINHRNVNAVNSCLADRVQKTLHEKLGPSIQVSVGGPQGEQRTPFLHFVARLRDSLGVDNENIPFDLVAVGSHASWLYSSQSVSIGGVTMTEWRYETQSMARVTYLMPADGSGQPVLGMDLGPCWGGGN